MKLWTFAERGLRVSPDVQPRKDARPPKRRNAKAADHNAIPYHWTLGNAPQAHKDMVAEFGSSASSPANMWVNCDPERG